MTGWRSTKRSSAITSNRHTATAPSSGCRTQQAAALAERAAERLASAGRRALDINGSAAAIMLLERALALGTEPSAGRAETLIALGEAIGRAGHLAAGQPYIEEALGWASNAGNDIIEAVATVALTSASFNLDPNSVVPGRQCRRGGCGRCPGDRRTASRGS